MTVVNKHFKRGLTFYFLLLFCKNFPLARLKELHVQVKEQIPHINDIAP